MTDNDTKTSISFSASAQEPPSDIPDYELNRRLGQGGYGEVWLARSRTGVYRAVKIIRKGSVSDVELDGIRAFERFGRGHSNLIDILHVGETSSYCYYVMELADGYRTAPTFLAADYEPRTLQSDLNRRGSLPLEEAITVVEQILCGLGHLHGQELLHRDVKPANVVFVKGCAKLADIGLLTKEHCRAMEGHTPAYAPPEGVIDRSGDLYCLGKVLFEMVTGMSPKAFPELPSSLDEQQRWVFQCVTPILDRTCAPRSDERFQSVQEFQHALDDLHKRLERRVTKESAAPRGGWKARSRWLYGTAVAVGLVISGLLIFQAFTVIRLARTYPGAVRLAGDGQSFRGLQLLCKDSSETVGYHMVSRYTVPLRTGELIRIRARLEEPTYPIVALITADSGVQIIYPRKVQGQRKLRELLTPPEDEWYRLIPPEGTLAFVLLASDHPVEDRDVIQQQLADLGGVPTLERDTILRYINGEIMPETRVTDSTRGLDLRNRVHVPASLLDRLPTISQEGIRVISALAVQQVGHDGPSEAGEP